MRVLAVSFLALALVPACSSPDPGGPDTGAVDTGARVDAPIGMTCSADRDCDDGVFCNGAETCSTGHCASHPLVCDDGVACTLDSCNETTRHCVAHAPDLDDDTFGDADCVDGHGVPLGTDCDDADPTAFPGNPETCNMHDEDCDPTTLGGGDTDHDGAVPTTCCNPNGAGGMTCGRDCDDNNPSISQLATEICDTIDNDCDTNIDEGAMMESWPDIDMDGYGDAAATPVITCTVPSSRANQGGDCNDTNDRVHPMAAERCNAVDDDCDGTTDEGGTAACMGTLASTSTMECVAGTCVVTGCGGSQFDCNGNPADGCESALCTSTPHCGSCGHSCGTSPGSCVTPGTCVITVNPQGMINGTVRDAVTGAVIPNAVVTSIDVCPVVTTTTRANGTFTLTVDGPNVPRWVSVTHAGYPRHVQPLVAGGFIDLFPTTTVTAWEADTDRVASASVGRAIVVIEGGPAGYVNDGHLGLYNGASGNNLLPTPMPGARAVFLDAVPGAFSVGGTTDLGGGCTQTCTPALDVWLEAGSVTHLGAAMCLGVC